MAEGFELLAADCEHSMIARAHQHSAEEKGRSGARSRWGSRLSTKSTHGAMAWLRIPTLSGQVFQPEAGHRSDVKPATIPINIRPL
ncbi:hypothetical protein [Mesorhizobium retamae]|uniref:Transposase n=1 Tax=Mesorhizobium retamae TaxID=2912854 RepID=A0ABS9QK78_9HYPH|nr:hypothetical protein [Mesorhizobium sp. IRAMC:0171]MCG7507848.1 hypothetical protein [Mesorhizobium sp. IRAMC:0171]